MSKGIKEKDPAPAQTALGAEGSISSSTQATNSRALEEPETLGLGNTREEDK